MKETSKLSDFKKGGSNSQNCKNKRIKITTKSLIFIIKLISSKSLSFFFSKFSLIYHERLKQKEKKYDEVLIKKLMN